MIQIPFSPQATYNFCKTLAGLVLFGTFLFNLRRELSLKRRIILLLFIFCGIVPVAQFTSRFFADSQGQSYTGALVAQILGIFCFEKIFRPSRSTSLKIWNLLAVVSGLVYAILRVGCHFRGCCWGKICGFDWAIYYRDPSVVTPQLFLPLHPVQLYSAIHGLIVALITWAYSKRFPRQNALGIFLFLMGTGRLFTDQFRADATFYEQSLLGLEPNTVLCLGLSLAGLILMVVQVRQERERAHSA